MAEARTIARPYAQAALQYAVDTNATAAWSTMLATLSQITQNPDAAKLLKHPQVTSEQKAAFMSGVAAKNLSAGGDNFLRLLAEYDRMMILPEIQELYQELLAKRDNSVTAEVRVAEAMTDNQAAAMTNALRKRFNCEVKLEIHVDHTLLAGALIRVGDLVIDGSLRGRFTRLAETLLN